MEARIDYQALEEWCGLEKVQVSQLGAIAGVTSHPTRVRGLK